MGLQHKYVFIFLCADYRLLFVLTKFFLLISLSEIQNARGIMDVLTEMLSAIDPANKEVMLSIILISYSGHYLQLKVSLWSN